MKFKLVVGVDVSKEWFNYASCNQSVDILYEGEEDNNPESILKFIDQFTSDHKLDDLDQVLLLMEHTGIYSQHLANLWMANGGLVAIVPANQISTGLVGSAGWDHKSDALDARRIAEYAVRFHDKIDIATPTTENLLKLSRLKALRIRLIKIKNILLVPVNESALFDLDSVSQLIANTQEKTVMAILQAISQTEETISKIIESDSLLKHYFNRLIKVDGVGPVTAVEVIIATDAFTSITPDQAAKFKRHARVAPVQKQSGKKKSKPRTSNRGSKRLNSLLTMGAMSVSKTKSELGQYYERKIAEGKEHMVVINALRAKIIDRMFAVIRNDTTYVKNLNLVLEKP